MSLSHSTNTLSADRQAAIVTVAERQGVRRPSEVTNPVERLDSYFLGRYPRALVWDELYQWWRKTTIICRIPYI